MARVFNHTSRVCLDFKLSPKIPRTRSKTVSEGNDIVPHDKSGFSEATMDETYRVLRKTFNRIDRHLEELTGNMSKISQHLAGLQLQAQQPRLAALGKVKHGMKTRAHKEDAATYEKFGDISSARDDGDPMSRTRFGDSADLSAPENSISDALVDGSAKAPKPRFSLMEMRKIIPADGLLHIGSASTVLRMFFSLTTSSLELRRIDRERGNGTTTYRKNVNQFAYSCRWKVIERNLSHNLVFDPGGLRSIAVAYFWEGGTRFFMGGFVWDTMMVSGA